MKYIVFLDGSAIIFSNMLDHKWMANGRPVKSAGFCRIETGRNQFDDIVLKHCSCFGRSETLNVNSDPNDAEHIQEIFIGMH